MDNDLITTEGPQVGNEDLVRTDEGPRREHERHYGQPELSMPWRIGFIVALVAVGLVSFFVLGSYFTDPEHYRATIEALDHKRETVMNLMAASTGSSAALSLLPGDAGTPLAEKLVDLSSDFLIVIAAIYLEKYLLTIMGLASFKLLIPVSCVVLSVALMIRRRTPLRDIITRLGAKLFVFALLAFLVVPASVYVSGMIESTYEASINKTIETAEQTADAIEESAADAEAQGQTQEQSTSNNPLSFLTTVSEQLTGQLSEQLGSLTKEAQNSLNNFIEALAVMIVTSCVIPILVLFFFLWLARIVLGLDINMSVPRRRWH